MRQIPYNNAAAGLTFDFPSDWDAQSITDVTLGIKNTSGDAMLAATSCTLWAYDGAVQINGAVTADENECVIELTGAGTLPVPVPGQRLQIAASAAGPAEEIEVLFYTVATKTITTTRDFRYDHSDNTAIVGLFCTYDLDTSTTTTWLTGRQVVLTWTPDTDDLPCKERGEVVISEFSVPGFNERFAALYPREYEVAVQHLGGVGRPDNRLPMFLDEAHSQLRMELMLRGLDINRVMDQSALVPSLMAKVRWLVLLSGDDRYDAERAVAIKEYSDQLELLSSAPIWGDDNQDEIRDRDEYEDHSQFFLERGL